jgi:Zn-dependent peptidase ImmA (M78 family)
MAVREDAARDAARIREQTWGDAIPVDPVLIARRLGIHVLDAPLGPDTSGALVKEREQDPRILLNSSDSANRKRFTCAHEIGHFVKRDDAPEEYEYVDLRGPLAATGSDPEERYANAFAACLLMPEDYVRQLHNEGVADLEMAMRFDVSREAMQNRLSALNLVRK